MAVENLVFEGGGIKGLAFAGAVYALEKCKILPTCKRFAGSSAGAITAALLAAGYTCTELHSQLFQTNWNSFIHATLGVASEAVEFAREWGLHSGDAFRAWVNQLLCAKLSLPKVTFADLYEKTGHELVVTGTNLNKRSQHFFHRGNHADMEVADAVRISMSIPMFFKPVRFQGDYYVDGGLLNNFPLWVFDSDTVLDCEPTNAVANACTLGFKLLSDAELTEFDTGLYPEQPINSLSGFSYALADAMLEQLDRLHVKLGDASRTVHIPVGAISSTDFALNADNKRKLVACGRTATYKFLAARGVAVPQDDSADEKDFEVAAADVATTAQQSAEMGEVGGAGVVVNADPTALATAAAGVAAAATAEGTVAGGHRFCVVQ
eukprot:TRINITY_DN6308_c0_g1_i1.p1 TRINITY_DN6308_c0_g1~~TRINITY_DN6308_c0_g1_i1.p1  ORF type:complete len:400 (+),score=107.11 TRINITY_DN6308_c0_g1_i1:65-1201(+)